MNVFWLALAVAFFFGMGPLFEKVSLREASPSAALAARGIITTTSFWIITLFLGYQREFLTWSKTTWSCIIASAIFGGVFGLMFLFSALKHGQVSVVVPIAASFPLFTMVFSQFFLHEPITPARCFGTVMIIIGCILVK